jgi:hypothetical protein
MSTATAKHVESDSVVSFAGNLWRVETSIEVYCYENEKSSSSKTNEEELVCMMYCTVCSRRRRPTRCPSGCKSTPTNAMGAYSLVGVGIPRLVAAAASLFST